MYIKIIQRKIYKFNKINQAKHEHNKIQGKLTHSYQNKMQNTKTKYKKRKTKIQTQFT